MKAGQGSWVLQQGASPGRAARSASHNGPWLYACPFNVQPRTAASCADVSGLLPDHLDRSNAGLQVHRQVGREE